MSKTRADETVSIRLPAGMANQLRAVTGQKLSTLARLMLSALLQKKLEEQQHNATQAQINAADAAAVVKDL